jgi:opacity protein-like surface antigen
MLLMLCIPARAEHSGPYVGVFVGGNELVKARSSDAAGDFALTFKPAVLGSAVIGWDFEKGNPAGEGRVELEYSRRSNPLDRAKFAEGSFSGEGSIRADSLLVNFFGIFHDAGSWAPYVGIGFGAARIEASGLKVTGVPMGSGSAVVFAYQVGGGVDVALTDRLSLDIGYRFFSTPRPTFTEPSGRTFAMDYLNHSAVLGLRAGF